MRVKVYFDYYSGKLFLKYPTEPIRSQELNKFSSDQSITDLFFSKLLIDFSLRIISWLFVRQQCFI